jgi:hypothetical protein
MRLAEGSAGPANIYIVPALSDATVGTSMKRWYTFSKVFEIVLQPYHASGLQQLESATGAIESRNDIDRYCWVPLVTQS